MTHLSAVSCVASTSGSSPGLTVYDAALLGHRHTSRATRTHTLDQPSRLLLEVRTQAQHVIFTVFVAPRKNRILVLVLVDSGVSLALFVLLSIQLIRIDFALHSMSDCYGH